MMNYGTPIDWKKPDEHPPTTDPECFYAVLAHDGSDNIFAFWFPYDKTWRAWHDTARKIEIVAWAPYPFPPEWSAVAIRNRRTRCPGDGQK